MSKIRKESSLDLGEQIPFTIDTSKISDSEKAMAFKKAIIATILNGLDTNERTPLNLEGFVITLDGEYAEIMMKLMQIQENGMALVAPGPNSPVIEMPISKLFHPSDYAQAFNVALLEEQNYNPDRPN